MIIQLKNYTGKLDSFFQNGFISIYLKMSYPDREFLPMDHLNIRFTSLIFFDFETLNEILTTRLNEYLICRKMQIVFSNFKYNSKIEEITTTCAASSTIWDASDKVVVIKLNFRVVDISGEQSAVKFNIIRWLTLY